MGMTRNKIARQRVCEDIECALQDMSIVELLGIICDIYSDDLAIDEDERKFVCAEIERSAVIINFKT